MTGQSKRIIVTGSAGVLGNAVARGLVEAGHAVAGIDRLTDDRLPATVHQCVAEDLADPTLAARAVEEARAKLGGVDGLVHLVGGFEWVPVQDSSLATWRSLFSINVETAFSTIMSTLPNMGEGASILCVSAAATASAGAGMGPYTASKSGVSRLVEALAVELKPRKIRVNAIMPSIIDTPRNRADMPDADPSDWTSPAAVADVVAFLIGDRSRAINGASIPVTNSAG
ncbi:SDR family oxidoreductase [Sphingobium estronivorans]|uniref:SDR family oxidoreductase n=1 Tax=Sphingobium estronivorans TaxID=1577690 RepID=UPI00123AA73D|nr:SDR family oxidoreductase [Sphingobium estronivorans]